MATHIFLRGSDGTGDIKCLADWFAAEIDGQGCSRLLGGTG